MLENFAGLIERFGMIPNGNRIYYSRRSQPPFFIQMVDLYVNDVGGDRQFVQDHIDVMEREFNFFMVNRTKDVIVNGKTYRLAHYDVEVNLPRPGMSEPPSFLWSGIMDEIIS